MGFVGVMMVWVIRGIFWLSGCISSNLLGPSASTNDTDIVYTDIVYTPMCPLGWTDHA